MFDLIPVDETSTLSTECGIKDLDKTTIAAIGFYLLAVVCGVTALIMAFLG